MFLLLSNVQKGQIWLKQYVRVKKAKGDFLKILVLFDQQSKTQTYSSHNYIKQWKAAKPHIGEAGTRQYFMISAIMDIHWHNIDTMIIILKVS